MTGKTHRIGKSLIEFQKTYGAEQQCLAFLEMARWPEGVECVRCDGKKSPNSQPRKASVSGSVKKRERSLRLPYHLATCTPA
jgi:hypothetical protein